MEMVMPWGQHAGEPLSELPSDYLDWVLRKPSDRIFFNLYLAIERVLRGRGVGVPPTAAWVRRALEIFRAPRKSIIDSHPIPPPSPGATEPVAVRGVTEPVAVRGVTEPVTTDSARTEVAEPTATVAVEWPERCLGSERLFGQPRARLFPLIASHVNTAQGPGRLLSVFRDVCHVALDDAPGRAGRRLVELLRPSDVWPEMPALETARAKVAEA
jgi:hypothetical protein